MTRSYPAIVVRVIDGDTLVLRSVVLYDIALDDRCRVMVAENLAQPYEGGKR